MSCQTYFYTLLFTTFLIRAQIHIYTKNWPSSGGSSFHWCLFETQKNCGSDAWEFQTKNNYSINCLIEDHIFFPLKICLLFLIIHSSNMICFSNIQLLHASLICRSTSKILDQWKWPIKKSKLFWKVYDMMRNLNQWDTLSGGCAGPDSNNVLVRWWQMSAVMRTKILRDSILRTHLLPDFGSDARCIWLQDAFRTLSTVKKDIYNSVYSWGGRRQQQFCFPKFEASLCAKMRWMMDSTCVVSSSACF
jgi:hypothetical protein